MITRYTGLVKIEYFEVSEKYIAKLMEDKPMPYMWFNRLPKYTINTNKGGKNAIIPSEYFLQFTGDPTSDKKYVMFDIETIDAQLKEEMQQAGVEDFFKGFDFGDILDNFAPQSDEDLENFAFPYPNYIVVELLYNYSRDHEGFNDCDMEVTIVGYLNGDGSWIRDNRLK